MTQPNVDIRALARLARVSISDEEVLKLEKEIPTIVAFVDTLQKVPIGSDTLPQPELRNVLREDKDPNEPGEYTERLLAEAPESDKGYIVVKQVLKK